MAITEQALETSVARGKEIYNRKIRPLVAQGAALEENLGKYVVINTQTEEWIMHEEDVVALRQALDKFGSGEFLHTIKVGYRAAAWFGVGDDFVREKPQ